MRSYGEKRDNELVSQNTLLKSVSSEKPLSAEQAFEDAQTLAKNGYTPENTARLLQEKGINIVQQLLNQEYPLNMVLFSPTIIVGTVTESYNYHNPDEFSSVISIISVEQVLKGDTTLKNFSMKEPLGYDGPPRLCEKCSYIFFLMPTVLTLKSQGKQMPMMHIASRYPLNLADQDQPRHKGSAEKITAYCKNLWTFFQSLNVIPDKY